MPFHPTSPTSSSDIDEYRFALAEVKGEVQLVQISRSTPPSSLALIDTKIFKHELATIFRHVQTTTLHPRDVHVIEDIGEDLVRYEEDTGTAFLVREIVDRMRMLTRRTVSPMAAMTGKQPPIFQSRYGLYAHYGRPLHQADPVRR